MATPQARGAALKKLLKKQYAGDDITSLLEFLDEGKLVPLMSGQKRTTIPDVETSKFEQRLSQIQKPRKGLKREKASEQRKSLRHVASVHFNELPPKWGHFC